MAVIQFEPRLHIDDVAAGQIESMLMPLLESPTVVITDDYPFALAAEFVKGGIRVRPATGEEITAFLTMGDAPNPDDFEWPGDPASPTGREIDWQETRDSTVERDRACHLWNGEVTLNSARGVSSPFYIHREAARAWALATALRMPERDVFEMQIVPYACVRRFAPGLITGGDAEFKRLNKFWISPVRSWGEVEKLALPGTEL